jgi:3-methyladenine DNA glycosylase AlkD
MRRAKVDQWIRKKLQESADEEYRKFNSGLLPNVGNILGVRMPLLHKLAKDIAKGDWRTFLEAGGEEYFEEIMLKGMVTAYADTDVEEKLRLVAAFVPKIGNWSVCDSFCISLKLARENKELVWEFLQPYLSSGREYELRFCVVMLLIHYIDESHIGEVLRIMDGIRHEGYYVKMAVAWAVSMCFAAFPEETMSYLRHNSLDDFTYNKTLQKIIESNQVGKKTKDLIRTMKRKSGIGTGKPIIFAEL